MIDNVVQRISTNTMALAVIQLKINDDKKDYYHDIIEDNIRYLSTTINDFMSFFDKRSNLELYSLEDIKNEVRSIIYTHLTNEKITLEVVVKNEYKDLKIASSITQVILNLIGNAKDTLCLTNKEYKLITLEIHSTKEGVSIECCDNGNGVDESVKDKIFDPYVTTKAKAQGTGIGLYTSKGIIQKVFHGEIGFVTVKDEGSCFKLKIPYSDNCVKNFDSGDRK